MPGSRWLWGHGTHSQGVHWLGPALAILCEMHSLDKLRVMADHSKAPQLKASEEQSREAATGEVGAVPTLAEAKACQPHYLTRYCTAAPGLPAAILRVDGVMPCSQSEAPVTGLSHGKCAEPESPHHITPRKMRLCVQLHALPSDRAPELEKCLLPDNLVTGDTQEQCPGGKRRAHTHSLWKTLKSRKGPSEGLIHASPGHGPVDSLPPRREQRLNEGSVTNCYPRDRESEPTKKVFLSLYWRKFRALLQEPQLHMKPHSIRRQAPRGTFLE